MKFSTLKHYYLEIFKPVGLVMSALVLTLLWILVIGLYALIIKLLRTLGIVKSPATGWRDCSPDTIHYQF